jgi:hypothetical protein
MAWLRHVSYSDSFRRFAAPGGFLEDLKYQITNHKYQINSKSQFRKINPMIIGHWNFENW